MHVLKNILIVEDEKAFSAALDSKLSKEGFITTVVPDGQQAVEAVIAGQYDLVFLELVMPKLDGLKALGYIRSLNKDIKIVVLASYRHQDDIARVESLGVSGFYVKSDTPISQIVAFAKELTR